MGDVRKLHYWLTGALVLLLFPVCYATRLILGFPGYIFGFMTGWILQSILWAGFLYQFGIPGALDPLRKDKKRFIVALAIPVMLVLLCGSKSSTWLIAMVAIVIVEFYYRRGNWAGASWALVPWAYLALGIEISIVLNTAVVSVRRFNLYDPLFRRLDAAIFDMSVSQLSHIAHNFYMPAEMVYYSMGGVMGAALLFLCLTGDRRSAFQMAGAIVICYYASLAIFLAAPSNGPYSLDPAAFSVATMTAAIQRASYANAAALYHHEQWVRPVLGYFVAFPSLHVAQPLIAGWFLRRWKRVSLFVFAYCGLLIPAIVILQWHYLVDIVGGILLAAVAVALVTIEWSKESKAATFVTSLKAERCS
jgi:hypothetical protein